MFVNNKFFGAVSLPALYICLVYSLFDNVLMHEEADEHKQNNQKTFENRHVEGIYEKFSKKLPSQF